MNPITADQHVACLLAKTRHGSRQKGSFHGFDEVRDDASLTPRIVSRAISFGVLSYQFREGRVEHIQRSLGAPCSLLAAESVDFSQQ